MRTYQFMYHFNLLHFCFESFPENNKNVIIIVANDEQNLCLEYSICGHYLSDSFFTKNLIKLALLRCNSVMFCTTYFDILVIKENEYVNLLKQH